jgi:hypothetical protein
VKLEWPSRLADAETLALFAKHWKRKPLLRCAREYVLAAQLLHFADSAMDPKHLENPAWRNAFDLDHDDAATTKRRLIDRAAADNANVLAYHFPFPSVGRVTKSGNAWKFVAAKA